MVWLKVITLSGASCRLKFKVLWKPHNVIRANVIHCLLCLDFVGPIYVSTHYYQTIVTSYCYPSVNVFSFPMSRKWSHYAAFTTTTTTKKTIILIFQYYQTCIGMTWISGEQFSVWERMIRESRVSIIMVGGC